MTDMQPQRRSKRALPIRRRKLNKEKKDVKSTSKLI